MSYRTELEKAIREQYLKNIEEVMKSPEDAALQEKIDNFLLRVPLFTKNDIVEKIQTDIAFAAFFAKDPIKQNICEKFFCSYTGLSILPQGNKNSIRFTKKGTIASSKKDAYTKAVDFVYNDRYFTQKYTGANIGGAQDNQYKDVVDFLIYGSLYNKVGACVDGWYWEEHGKKQELKELFRDNQNVIICSAEDIKGGHI